MYHFDTLEKLGAGLASMSERSDGDATQPEKVSAILRSVDHSPHQLATVSQVHGTRIVESFEGGEADGIITDSPEVVLGIRVADCVPVAVIDPIRRAIGLFHAGRVGTIEQISNKGVEAMVTVYQSQAKELHAFIGPSAGPCCYEVSEYMAAEFRESGWKTQGRHLDLWDANLKQLIEAGVPRENINCPRICTICDGRFFSYRHGDAKARNIALLSL